MAGPIDSDVQLRLTASMDRAVQKTMRRRPRERLQFTRLRLERIVKASKPESR
jgi:hypothetical protein